MADQFPSTIWDLVREGRDGSPEAKSALVNRYLAPMTRYVRGAIRGMGDEEVCATLVHDIILKVSASGFLTRVRKKKGGLRPLMKTVAIRRVTTWQRTLYSKKGLQENQKRSMTDPKVAINADEKSASRQKPVDPFDKEWARDILEKALNKLKADDGNAHAALLALVLDDSSHQEVAEKLGIKVSKVKNRRSDAQRKLKDLICKFISEYCDPKDVEDELRDLKQFLGDI